MIDFMLGILFYLFWILCWAISYGIFFAWYQREYSSIAEQDYTSDQVFSFVWSCGGPFSLLMALVCCEGAKHGLKFQ